MRQPTILFVAFLLATSWPVATACAQVKAFPEAEGFGATATGGRGGDVYHVTNLLDTNTVGTLRYGIENATGPRTIVFDVGGWINLTSKLGVTKSNITIAGQTAPGGVGVRGNQFSVGGDNIIVRHMRFRPGKGAGRVDSVGINADAQNVIFDHISAGFSYDENFSLQAADVTLQYSTVSYGLEDHSAGSLIEQANRLSVHHSLYAHNNTRNPKARVNGNLDWINNVVYDYNNGFIAGDSDTTDYFWTANVDGNYYINGPGNPNRPMITSGRAHNYGLYFGTNAYDNDGDALHDGTLYTGNGVDATGLSGVVTGTYTWASTPYATPDIWQEANPQAAYERVLSEFGATPWQRDQVDQLLHSQVVNRTGGFISHENQLIALGVGDNGFGVLGGGAAPLDSDGDGMPNAWETARGLNPSSAADRNTVHASGYTMLEMYLNEEGHKHDKTTIWSAASGTWNESAKWDFGPGYIYDNVRIHGTGAASGQVTVSPASGPASAFRLGIGGNGTAAGEQVIVNNETLTVMDSVSVGDQNHGKLQINSGLVRAESVLLGDTTSNRGTLELAGGTLATARIAKLAGGGNQAQFTWSGGALLRPRRDTYVTPASDAARKTMTIDVPVTLGAGGGVLDTAGHNADFNAAISGPGLLTKQGQGLLRLFANNTFAGPLIVNEGGVKLSSAATLAGTTSIELAAGTVLDATAKSGGFVLGNGQQIEGKGSIAGHLTAASGSIVRPFGQVNSTVHAVGLQAESLALGSNWAIFNNSLHGTGNGGSYNGADLDGGGIVYAAVESPTGPNVNGLATGTVNLPVGGAWYLYAKVVEPTVSGITGDTATHPGGNNSFWVSASASSLQATTVNFDEVQTANDTANIAQWVKVSPAFTALEGVDGTLLNAGINYSLTAGTKTFAIGGREIGTVLDAFVVANANLTAAQLNAAVDGTTSFLLGDTLTVEGNYVQSTGATLAIEIGSQNSYNKLTVEGSATLNGLLHVSLPDLGGGAYVPQAGDSFEILSAAGGLGGSFTQGVTWPALTGFLEWDIDYQDELDRIVIEVSTPFAADYDGDGDVDHNDLNQWNAAYATSPAGDTDGDGDTDGLDFLTWQREYTGDLSPLAAAMTVPEPATVTLTGLGLVLLWRRGRTVSAVRQSV